MIDNSENPSHFEELKCEIISCWKCPRLTAWREKVGMEKRRAFRDQEYWAKPVPGFGDEHARVLLLGLAPGAHGSNRTGRMFTGDDSGRFLYAALHKAGFANQPNASRVDDGLVLTDVYITAVCRCAPPDNKPTREEMDNCQPFLLREYDLLNRTQGIVAFGKIAYDAAFKLISQSEKNSIPRFGHAVFHPSTADQPWILASYHPSRQNTQTGRLTTAMFDHIWMEVRRWLEPGRTTSG
jgi:uracil-DNA glycosylase family 4